MPNASGAAKRVRTRQAAAGAHFAIPKPGSADVVEHTMVKKDVAFVHCYAPGANLVPLKLMYALISASSTQTPDDHLVFRAPLKEIKEKIGYSSTDHTAFRDALTYLRYTTIAWNYFGKTREEVGESSFIGSWNITNDKTLEWTFPGHLLQRVRNPEIFAVLDEVCLRGFSRVAGLVLYENCRRYHALGVTPWLSIDTWRKILGATSETYDATKHLINKVIKPAVAEVHAVSEIDVKLETRRCGRAISEMRFWISDQPQQNLDISGHEGPESSELAQQLKTEYGIHEDVARRLTGVYSEDHILSAIEAVRPTLEKGNASNVAGLVVRAIERDYKRAVVGAEKKKKESEAARVAAEQAKEQGLARANAAAEKRVQAALGIAAKMTTAEREALFDSAVRANPMLRSAMLKRKEAFVASATVADRMVLAALVKCMDAEETAA